MLARAGGARRAALRVVACKLRPGGALQPVLVRGLAASPLYAPPTSAAFRSHTCYDVKDVPAGQSVRLTGWVNNLREMGGIMFVTLRDAYGLVQLTTDDVALIDQLRTGSAGGALRSEAVLTVDGVVRARPAHLVNPGMATGTMEVVLASARVLSSPHEALPLVIGASASGSTTSSAASSTPATASGGPGGMASEDVRLAHRYLDLRRSVMQRNLRLRSVVTHAIRSYMHAAVHPPFVEVETPTLFRSTPEGAREFLVPTRQRGKMFALTQSPQQYKQLLVVGGVDRYFQIARCYRDESGRADRQPEFTQVDIEMACPTRGDVMAVAEGLLGAAFQAARQLAAAGAGSASGGMTSAEAAVFGHVASHASLPSSCHTPLVPWEPLALPLPRVTYSHALATYGSDKPDRRVGMPIRDVTGMLAAGAGGVNPLPQPFAAAIAGSCGTLAPVYTAPDDADLTQLLPSKRSVRAFVARGAGAAISKKDGDLLAQEVRSAVGLPAVAAPSTPAAGSVDGSAAPPPPAPTSGFGDVDIAYLRVQGDGTWRGHALIKAVAAADQQAVTTGLGAAEGDMIVMAAGPTLHACKMLGAARLICAETLRTRGVPLTPHDTAVTVAAHDIIIAGRNLNAALTTAPPAAAGSGAAKGKQGSTPGKAAAAPEPATVSTSVDAYWVTDFPLFELTDDVPAAAGCVDGGGAAAQQRLLQSTHHPFTAPTEADEPVVTRAIASLQAASVTEGGAVEDALPPLIEQLLLVRGQHYDLVCNGVELGGGSIRIHTPNMQLGVLQDVLRVPSSQLHGFKHLLTALASGAPPHGGIAFGLDRLLVTLAGPAAAASVRDVIAFPKSTIGNDLMTASPAPVSAEQLREYHIQVVMQ